MSSAPLIARYDRLLEQAVRRSVPGDRPVALVNFPNHANAGDPAVWLGAERLARRAGLRVGYRASWGSFDPGQLVRAIGSGPVLIGGGGNLGDVYENQQRTRERVLRELPDNLVLQLPQSVWFRDQGRLEAFAELARDHGRARFLVRDRPSLELLREVSLPARLAPDLAFALGPLTPPRAPVADVVGLLRRDRETSVDPSGEVPAGRRAIVLDWIDDLSVGPVPTTTQRLAHVTSRLGHDAARDGRLGPRWPVLAASFGPLARAWVHRGCWILAQGRVVITNRLHAHLLALLMGIPSVVLDNATGKVHATLDEWTGEHPLVRRASTLAEAWHHADRMLALAHR